MRRWPLLLVATIGSVAACNGLFGLDELEYVSPTAPTTAGGGDGGFGGFGGATSSTGGSGGAGGTGGAGGPAEPYCEAPLVILCMRFEGDLNDEGPHGQVVTGMPTFGPGAQGEAVVFDGKGGLLVATPQFLAVPTLTLELWARNDGGPIGAGRRALIDYNAHWGLFAESSGLSVAQGATTISGVPLPEDGGWHHYAVTNDGVESRLYIDGVVAGTGGPGPLNPSPDSDALAIGDNAPGGGDEWVGAIDELRVFSFARSPDQIADAAKR